MPFVEVTLTQGRSADQLRSLIQELHEAVVRSGVAEAPAVRIIVREVPATHWASGGVTIAERQARRPPQLRRPFCPAEGYVPIHRRYQHICLMPRQEMWCDEPGGATDHRP
jgi:4-oxalocrotonate tautomerase